MLSDLHLSLIAAGATAVVSVWGYNLWQAYRQRKVADSITVAGHPDVPTISEDSDDRTLAATVGVQPERLEPALSEVSEADTLCDRALGEPPIELADDLIDCIVRLEETELVAAPLLWGAQRQVFGPQERRLRWICLDENSGLWQRLTPQDAASYRRFRAAFQIADRNGAISESELTRVLDGLQRIAADFQLTAEIPAAAVILARARALDELCASVDWRLALNVVNLGGKTLTAARLIDLATESRLWLKDDNLFHAEDDSGATLFTMSNLGGRPFVAEGLASLALSGITFGIDVPRVTSGAKAFDGLLDVARQVMAEFDGTLVDDQRAPLSDDTLATIRAKVEEFQEKMAENQIPAGGRRALRLYA